MPQYYNICLVIYSINKTFMPKVFLCTAKSKRRAQPSDLNTRILAVCFIFTEKEYSTCRDGLVRNLYPLLAPNLLNCLWHGCKDQSIYLQRSMSYYCTTNNAASQHKPQFKCRQKETQAESGRQRGWIAGVLKVVFMPGALAPCCQLVGVFVVFFMGWSQTCSAGDG